MSDVRRPGRRPGDPEITKQSILDAAKAKFGEVGFDRATIRSIAAAADVDPALVHHYFGTKQDLFSAAHELPMNPSTVIETVAGLPPEERGEAIARLYLTVLAAPGSAALSLLRAAATHESAARMMSEYIDAMLLGNAELISDEPDARLRVSLVGSHMIGVAYARVIVGLPEIATADVDELVAILGPVINRYLSGPLGS